MIIGDSYSFLNKSPMANPCSDQNSLLKLMSVYAANPPSVLSSLAKEWSFNAFDISLCVLERMCLSSEADETMDFPSLSLLSTCLSSYFSKSKISYGIANGRKSSQPVKRLNHSEGSSRPITWMVISISWSI